VFGLAAGAIIIYRHRSNIDRLRAGTERKLGRTPAEAHWPSWAPWGVRVLN